jgi:ABC-2 type transport system ATP-binding protein
MSMQLRGLGIRLGRTTILDGVSFDVPDGTVTGFLGHNGSGKTTSMRSVLGLLPGAHGQVYIDGLDAAADPREGRARIGALIEHCAFYPGWSGRRNLYALGIAQGLSGAQARSEAAEHFEAVGLGHAGDRPVRTYSQGMRQRLGIAQALLGGPSNLILDEPTNGLDPEGIAEMRRLLEGLAKRKGLAILLSSHQLHELQGLTERVVVLKKGRIIAEGETRLLLGDPRGRYAIDGPERSRLSEALASRGLKVEPAADGAGVEVELAGRAPSELLSGLVRGGHSIERFAPKRLDLVDFYLHANEQKPPVPAALPPARQPDRRRAPTRSVARILHFERLRLTGVLPWLLLPAAAGAVRIWALSQSGAAQAGQVANEELFSATEVTAFSAVLKALETGLPLLALFAAGLASQTLAGELGRGTLRNLAQRGLTRWAIGLGKLLAQCAAVLLGYAGLLLTAVLVAKQFFAFGDLNELLPNGERFPIQTAAEVWPAFRAALLAPLLPLLGFVGLGFAIGSLLRTGATALGVTIGAVLALDLSRGLLPVAWQGWTLSSYLPTPLGDRSEVHAVRLLAEGATNAVFQFAHLRYLAPPLWLLLCALAGLVCLKLRRIP